MISSTAIAQITNEEIDTLVENTMSRFETVGVAVGIVKDGEIYHCKGYGVKSIETKEKVNEYTNFAIASNTKAFTVAALAILIDEGKLSLHDRVRDHIPELKMYDEYVTENITILDLLSFRSGLGSGAGDLMCLPDGSDFCIKDVLTCFQHFEPETPFRTSFGYSNISYIIAGEIIKRVSGLSWEDFVQTRILTPLNMDHSFSSYSRIPDHGNVATPHSYEMSRLKTIPHFYFDPEKMNDAAGGIYSNVNDICQWALLQLNKGKYGKNLEKVLFSEDIQKEMWKLYNRLPIPNDLNFSSHFYGSGLGCGILDINGNFVVAYGGSNPGMLSYFYLVPDIKLGVVVLTNTEIGGAIVMRTIGRTILDRYLNLDAIDWGDKLDAQTKGMFSHADSVTSAVWETVKSADMEQIDIEDYIGIYKDNWFGKTEVYLNQGQLWFKSYRSPKLNGQMRYYKANTFAIKWEYQDINGDAFAIFSLDENGKAESIRLKGISPLIDFSFDYKNLDLRRVGK